MEILAAHPTIIVDIGTETIKIGYANDEFPKHVTNTKDFVNQFTSPFNKGKISSISKYCQLLIYSLKQFDRSIFSSSQLSNFYSLVICLKETDFNNIEVRNNCEKILHHVFGNYQGFRSPFNSLFFANSHVCDLFGSSKTTGLVCSLSSFFSATGIVDGLIKKHENCDYGALELTKNIFHIFKDKISDYVNSKFKNESDDIKKFRMLELARQIKEEAFYFYSQNIADNIDFEYEINNSFKIKVLKEDIKELIIKVIADSVALIKKVIEKIDNEDKNVLLSNIVLTGGMANMYIAEKIEGCLIDIYPENRIKVFCEKDTFHTFLGASVLGSLGDAKSLFISNMDYGAYGANILERKKFNWAVE
ncbi:hypothetical protein EDEG_01579 [Edhazardia aedis USNM 41457]|uniref:Actin-like protein N-terminal domain-containing protein n=1 Tax=Edhazardia aedis (strain USNM 41457) TaxID=1003232 RepID=J8ZWV1_EDHAE|nr:hypothetical protein EDEG_01579 [Edhazardia aedis USNM 41457]|eukprot:EJW04143.1 hypothetical protein EDEG_01579 [Edhazardia aedis USNM 41457]